ncbi:hypothetical protein J2S43_004313 [Catenuloplanes nepalensis]|uniref:Uncharacterized protein n=1 Tax=Catenuloplanes nepalensis TaxID=587533 RepID=A0ABT9MXP7_9ACTN|nr:hypothetical protein [Catenuloplanes nepalensis]MDP9795801.1 hypothetical protein [Catenuloplanes nepalensis]
MSTDLEHRLRAAFATRAGLITPAALRPPAPPTLAPARPRARLIGIAALTAATALAITAIAPRLGTGPDPQHPATVPAPSTSPATPGPSTPPSSPPTGTSTTLPPTAQPTDLPQSAPGPGDTPDAAVSAGSDPDASAPPSAPPPDSSAPPTTTAG